jgi:hypothetical protein
VGSHVNSYSRSETKEHYSYNTTLHDIWPVICGMTMTLVQLLHWNAVAALVRRWKVKRSPSTKRPTISNSISKSLRRRHKKIECQELYRNLDKNRSQQLSWTHGRGLQEAGKTERRSKIGCQTLTRTRSSILKATKVGHLCICYMSCAYSSEDRPESYWTRRLHNYLQPLK